MRGARVALLLSLCFATACGEDATDNPNDESLTVTGRVSVLNEGGGISGASVRFLSDTLDEVTVTTDDKGDYTLVVVTDSDRGRVIASAAGFETRTLSVLFDTPIRRVNIELARQ